MRSVSDSSNAARGDFVAYVPSLSAIERERLARCERARVIGELVADAVLWLVRLPRRVGALISHAAPSQRI